MECRVSWGFVYSFISACLIWGRFCPQGTRGDVRGHLCLSWGRALGIQWVGSREAAPYPHGTQDTPTEDAVSRGH